MSTSEVFQLCLVIIGVVSLVYRPIKESNRQASKHAVTSKSNTGGKPSTGSALSIFYYTTRFPFVKRLA